MNVIVNGLDINYEQRGAGPVMLMLHGWGSDLHVYDALSKVFRDRYNVVCLDWPGFGRSQAPNTTWGIDEFASLAEAFCTKTGLQPSILVGHSMGGQTAVHLVGSGLLQPQKLILLAASAVRPAPGRRELAYQAVAKLGKAVIRNRKLASRLKAKLYNQAGTTDYLNSGAMQASYRLIITQDQLQFARHITIPTLLIWGDQDNDAPIQRGRLLHQTISGSSLEVLPGAGHYVFIDEPEKTIAFIKKFIDA